MSVIQHLHGTHMMHKNNSYTKFIKQRSFEWFGELVTHKDLLYMLFLGTLASVSDVAHVSYPVNLHCVVTCYLYRPQG